MYKRQPPAELRWAAAARASIAISRAAARASSLTGAPCTRTRSFTRSTCGEVRVPQRCPANWRAALTRATTVPLPLEPATCTDRKRLDDHATPHSALAGSSRQVGRESTPLRMAKQLTEIAACVRRRSHLRSPRGGRLPISQPRERFEPGRQPRGHRALLVEFEQGINTEMTCPCPHRSRVY